LDANRCNGIQKMSHGEVVMHKQGNFGWVLDRQQHKNKAGRQKKCPTHKQDNSGRFVGDMIDSDDGVFDSENLSNEEDDTSLHLNFMITEARGESPVTVSTCGSVMEDQDMIQSK